MRPVCIFFSVVNSRCSSIFFLFTSISLTQLETMAEICLCGNVVMQLTSWTQTNPGRRFAACVDRRCNKSFRWLEEPVCSRAQVIIPGLLRRINKLEEEKMELEAKLAKNALKKHGSYHCSWSFSLLILAALISYMICNKVDVEGK